jgi:hypothetical protein
LSRSSTAFNEWKKCPSSILTYSAVPVPMWKAPGWTHREFFDSFDEIVEKDAVWGYKFQREYNKKIKDPDDIYLEIKDSGDCLRAWSSCPAGICPTKNATTSRKPKSDGVSEIRIRKERRSANRAI